jgi:hypothetical protein
MNVTTGIFSELPAGPQRNDEIPKETAAFMKAASKIFGPDYIGIESALAVGVSIPAVRAKLLPMGTFRKEMLELHGSWLIVAVPPVSLADIVFARPRYFEKRERNYLLALPSAQKVAGTWRWLAVRKKTVVGGLPYGLQKKAVIGEERVPTLVELAWVMVAARVVKNEILFQNTYIRTSGVRMDGLGLSVRACLGMNRRNEGISFREIPDEVSDEFYRLGVVRDITLGAAKTG